MILGQMKGGLGLGGAVFVDDVRGASSLGEEVDRVAYSADEITCLERGSHREHRELTGPIIECARSMAAGDDLDGPSIRIDRYEHSARRISQLSVPGNR